MRWECFGAAACLCLLLGCAASNDNDKGTDAVDAGSGTTGDGDGSGEGGAGPGAPPGAPGILSGETLYSGYDGTNVYKLPIALPPDATSIPTVEDTTIATIEAVDAPSTYPELSELKWAMVTTAGVGETNLVLDYLGEQSKVKLVVQSYTTAQVDAGKARYENGVATGVDQECQSCHVQGLQVDHTPWFTADFDDACLVSLITTAKCTLTYGDGETYEYDMGITHTWNLDTAAQGGIVAYLRSLPPRGF